MINPSVFEKHMNNIGAFFTHRPAAVHKLCIAIQGGRGVSPIPKRKRISAFMHYGEKEVYLKITKIVLILWVFTYFGSDRRGISWGPILKRCIGHHVELSL